MKKHELCAMRDISGREDIIILINSFYEKVRVDEQIGYIFNDIAKVDWAHHLPVMYDFWESVIFFKSTYSGNPMEIHSRLNKQVALTPVHFEKWKSIFLQTVNELFEGEKAELAKQRAVSIATAILIKISQGSYKKL